MSSDPHPSWGDFFEREWQLENQKGPIAPRADAERALRLMAAANAPANAAALLGISTDSLFRIATGFPVREATLNRFHAEIERAEEQARPVWEARLAKRCGLQPRSLTDAQWITLARQLGEPETARIARELDAEKRFRATWRAQLAKESASKR